MLSLKRALVVLGLIYAGVASAAIETNLCYNGNFDSPNGPLDGWNVDYRWMKNKFFMANHENVSVLPLFQSVKNVLFMNPPLQGRVESKPIPIDVENRARYECTMNLWAGDVRFYFNCYEWEPGIAPHDDPKLWELRRIYKGEPYTGGGNGQKISFHLPMEEISTLAWDHYKKVRFATVYMTAYRGGWHAANVKVVKLPGTFKVVNKTKKISPGSVKPMPKLVTPKDMSNSSPIENDRD